MAIRKKIRHPMLRMEGPGFASRYVDLLRDSYSIGRGDPTGEVQVDFEVPKDEHLSRRHLTVTKTPKGFEVENQSPNGSMLNGRPLTAPKRLSHKDKIEIGSSTTLEFFIYADDERAKALQIAPGTTLDDAATSAVGVGRQKSFFQRPIFMLLLGFYGIVAVLLSAVLGKDPPKVITLEGKPGEYLDWIFDTPVRDRAKTRDETAGEAMWAKARLEHGDELTFEGDHAYRLALAARKVAAVLNYGTLEEARASGETFALIARKAVDDLEERLKAWLNEGADAVKYRHKDAALRAYEAIIRAIPNPDENVRQYAAMWLDRLRRR